MLDTRNKHTAAREKILADGIREVVAELRLVEVVDFIAFLRMNQLGNIADIVRSSSELHLTPGALRFAGSGEVDLAWGTVPVIVLHMQFRHEPATAHFRLVMGAVSASVDIQFLTFDTPGPDPEADTERLRGAVEAARLKPRLPAEAH